MELPQTYVSSHIMTSLRGGPLLGKDLMRGTCMRYLLTVQEGCSLCHEGWRDWLSYFCLLSAFPCVNIFLMYLRLTLMYVAVLRSQDLFPWKQGAGGEMATPPKWEKRLVLSLVSQVSPQIAFQNISSPT